VINQSESYKAIENTFHNETWINSALIGLFILENKENPNYKPWIDMFPTDFSNFPIYFNQDRLKLL